MQTKAATISIATSALCLLSAVAAAQAPLGTAFTYEGHLKKAGVPLTGTADFLFSLWDAGSGGMQVGSTVAANNVTVDYGLFTVNLDFGAAAFNGDARWLEIAARSPAGSGSYTTLSPRQALDATPYALHARAPWATGSGSSLSYTAGNVGIGTATPAARLSVVESQPGVNAAWIEHTAYNDQTPALIVRHFISPDKGIALVAQGGYMGIHGAAAPSGSTGEFYGVEGYADGGSATNFGVKGYARGAGVNYAVWGKAAEGAVNYAGYFDGNVHAGGTTTIMGSLGVGTAQPRSALDVANGTITQSDSGPGYGLTSVLTAQGTLDSNGNFYIDIPQSLLGSWQGDNYVVKMETFVCLDYNSGYPHNYKGSAYAAALVGKQRGDGLAHFAELHSVAFDATVTFAYSSPQYYVARITADTNRPSGTAYRVTVRITR